MAYVKKAKRFVRRVGKKVLGMAKKRYVSKGRPNVSNIYKDVMMLKKLINVEKKRVDVSVTTVNFGQFNGVGIGGASCQPITPVIVQGITGSTRNGNSLKLVSACLDIQFAAQLNSINGLNLKWYLINRKDNSVDTTAAIALGDFLEPNVFSGVIDYHSNRDPEFFKNFTVIKSGTAKLTPDSVSGNTAYAQRKIPLKLSHHLRYNTDATTITTINKFFLIFTADTGDSNIATGCAASFAIRYYYVDN